MENTEVIETGQRAVSTPVEAAPVGSPMAMVIAGMQSGMTPEQIAKFMDLQDRYNAGQAKKAFDEAFAAFKAEAITITKGKTRAEGPLKGQKYAELHDVVNAVTPALSRHGLSSSWKLTKDEKDWMEVTCYLRHIGGHEESVSMGGPPDAGSAKNSIQARASTKTYLERYTLKAITGLSEQDDDDDGRGGIAEKYADVIDDWVAAAEGASSLDDLERTWQDGQKELAKTDSLQIYNRFKAAVLASRKRLEAQK